MGYMKDTRTNKEERRNSERGTGSDKEENGRGGDRIREGNHTSRETT